MPKYLVETKCFGYKGRLWEKGQIVVLGDTEKPPIHFKRMDGPKPEAVKPEPRNLAVEANPLSAAEKAKLAKKAEADAVEARKLAKAAAKKAGQKNASAEDKAKAEDLEKLAKEAGEAAAKAKQEALEASEAAKPEESSEQSGDDAGA
jgi:hypothetical protein